MNPLRDRLQEGIEQLGLQLSSDTEEQMLAYLDQLSKWNKTFNLTAITDPVQMVTDHLLDALSILPYLDTKDSLLDVGTGGGIPGIPIALCYPHMPVTLLDANQKKTTFLRQVAIEVNMENLTVATSRVEDFVHPPFQTIISRAFSSLKDFVTRSDHLLAQNGQWFAMKGKIPAEEIAVLPSNYVIDDIIALSLPHSTVERHLVIIKRSTQDE